jgi:hypothetical protein
MSPNPYRRRWSSGLLVAALAVGGLAFTGTPPASANLVLDTRPHAQLTIEDSVAVVGRAISISTKGSRAAAGLRSLTLAFGDGKQVTGHDATVRVRHRYAKPGTYTVRLTVIDRAGRRDRIAQNVLVGFPTGSLPPVDTVTGTALPGASQLPKGVSLKKWTMPVQNQAPREHPGINSCVAWTVGYAMMGWYYKHHYSQDVAFAPMYIYAQAHGAVTNGQPTGMAATKALDILKTQGIDTAQHYGAGWAYDWGHSPQSGDVYTQNAANYRISGYHTLYMHRELNGASPTERDMIKAALAASTPVAIAMAVRDDFYDYSSGQYRAAGNPTGSNHEMLAVGYSAKGLLVQNSWGASWGKNGFVRISWRAVHRDVYEADVIDGLVTPGGGGTTDKVPPTVSAPGKHIQAGTKTSTAGVPVTFSWQGADDSGTVAGYQLQASTNGGQWTQQSLSSATATSTTFVLTPGSKYQFRVAAVDGSGNSSQWATGTAFTVGDYDDTSEYVKYFGTWSRLAWGAADGGTITASGTAGSYATFSFVGSNVAWVAVQNQDRGQANVYLDDNFVTTVDLYSATPVARYIALHGNWPANESHKLTIQVVGTVGRPTIDIDSFVLLY